ncbi:hypothetical protein DXG01_001080 [Tephrocybe rancida]|nr:hypothetical protein DXG01_001080 [Tephrocybe rancida]
MNKNVTVAPAPAAAPPIVNVITPNNMFVLFHPAPAPNPAVPAVPGPAVKPSSSALIPSHLQPGIKQNIITFCQEHDLSDAILTKLTANVYTGTQAFYYIKKSDLTDMGFL